jgi:hypothetical protein
VTDDESEVEAFESQLWQDVLHDLPDRCPQCGASTVAYVLWGMPALSPTLERLLAEGQIEIGGCVVPSGPYAPAHWVCGTCRHAWGIEGLTRVPRHRTVVGPECAGDRGQ